MGDRIITAPSVEQLTAERDQLQETINLLYADREALWRVVKEACATLRVTDDDEKDWPKLDQAVEALKAQRDRLDLMLRCELGDETASPGYAEALAAYEGDPEEFCPPWFFDGDWHHADSGIDLHRFLDVDCGAFWSAFTTDPDYGVLEPRGPKYRTALEAMEAIGAGGCPMADRYEAMVGYDLDGECATWGAGATSSAALMDACQRFMAEQADYIEPGAYEATVYDTPLERKRTDGDVEVFSWLDRGTATMTVGADGRYVVGPITWDAVSGVSDG